MPCHLRGLEVGAKGSAAAIEATCKGSAWHVGLVIGLELEMMEPMSQSLLLSECEQRSARAGERQLLFKLMRKRDRRAFSISCHILLHNL